MDVGQLVIAERTVIRAERDVFQTQAAVGTMVSAMKAYCNFCAFAVMINNKNAGKTSLTILALNFFMTGDYV